MKKSFSLLAALLLTVSLFAVAPQKISYQAVVRNSTNALVVNSTIGMQISILQGSATGTAIYVERFSSATNANGLVTIEIGTGTVISGSFVTIDWSTGTYFIKTETDLNGGANYTITGTSQMLSVPYAMYAQTAEFANTAATKTDITAMQTQINENKAKQTADIASLQATVNNFITTTNATLTTLMAREISVETILTAAQADIAKLKGDFAAQLVSIVALQTNVSTHTADIVKLKTDLTALQTVVIALQTVVNKNTSDIATNTAAIAALQSKFAVITSNFKAIATAINMNYNALSSRLTSLEFVSDFSVNGNSAINFSGTTLVTVAYQMNPSFITQSDIETNNMAFVVLPTSNLIKTSLQLAKATKSAQQIKAIFNKIENGKLYVDVKVDDINILTSTLGQIGTNSIKETFNSIALQVPLSQKAVQECAITYDSNDNIVLVGGYSYPTNRVITSDYVRIYK